MDSTRGDVAGDATSGVPSARSQLHRPLGGAAADLLPQGEDKRAMVRSMFDRIAPRYDLVNRIMTFGLDLGWRRHAIRLLGIAPGSVVVDLACGTGDLLAMLEAGEWLGVGVDLSAGMLTAAKARSRESRSCWRLVQGEGSRLPLADGAADGVVSGFALRNFDDLALMFAEVARVVRPYGRVAFLDVDDPGSRLLRTGHHLYFTHVVPRIGGLLSDGAAYRYLPRSVAYLPGRDQLLALLETAGFTEVEHHSLAGGVTQVLTGTRVQVTPR
jgi:demethylmenaquinone methyltransferase/2-methoxy-6-polyprenyl-1,4-benzoquinol methylase